MPPSQVGREKHRNSVFGKVQDVALVLPFSRMLCSSSVLGCPTLVISKHFYRDHVIT